jgi:hypothetical protein
VRPDGYIAYASTASDLVEALKMVRSLLHKQTIQLAVPA